MQFRHCGIFLLMGCGTLNSAVPLEQGEHALGVTFGGPVITALGPPIPTPNLVVEGVSGRAPFLNRPTDINYGVNMTALAFGVVGTHFGSSLLIFGADGARPNFSIADRFYLYSNHFDTTKPEESRQLYMMDQIDLTTSWPISRHLAYTGVGTYVDFADPEFILAPFVGMELRSQKRFFFQWEVRHLGVNRQPDVVDVTFASIAGQGGISTTLSAGWMLKGDRQ
jgi:hypothetical protein